MRSGKRRSPPSHHDTLRSHVSPYDSVTHSPLLKIAHYLAPSTVLWFIVNQTDYSFLLSSTRVTFRRPLQRVPTLTHRSSTRLDAVADIAMSFGTRGGILSSHPQWQLTAEDTSNYGR